MRFPFLVSNYNKYVTNFGIRKTKSWIIFSRRSETWISVNKWQELLWDLRYWNILLELHFRKIFPHKLTVERIYKNDFITIVIIFPIIRSFAETEWTKEIFGFIHPWEVSPGKPGQPGWLKSWGSKNKIMQTLEWNCFFFIQHDLSQLQYTYSNDPAMISYHLCDEFLESL